MKPMDDGLAFCVNNDVCSLNNLEIVTIIYKNPGNHGALRLVDSGNSGGFYENAIPIEWRFGLLVFDHSSATVGNSSPPLGDLRPSYNRSIDPGLAHYFASDTLDCRRNLAGLSGAQGTPGTDRNGANWYSRRWAAVAGIMPSSSRRSRSRPVRKSK
jgi:hypothetical protein